MTWIKWIAALTVLLYLWGCVLGWGAGHGLKMGLGL